MMDFDLRTSDFKLIGRKEGFENLSEEIEVLGGKVGDASSEGCSSPSYSYENSDDHGSSEDEAGDGWEVKIDDWLPARERGLSFDFFSFPFEAETSEADTGSDAAECSQPNERIDVLSELYGDHFQLHPHGQTQSRKVLKRAIRDPVTGSVTGRHMSVRVIFSDEGQSAGMAAQIVGAVGESTDGLLFSGVERMIGVYTPQARKARLERFHNKRKRRVWKKKIKYDCRKKLADSRPRVKGRFVKRKTKDGRVIEGDGDDDSDNDMEEDLDGDEMELEEEILEVGDASDLSVAN